MATAEVEMMIRGMGLGMKVLELLEAQIWDEGGNAEILAFLTRPRFAQNLRTIARAAIACDWRYPASEMRKRALKAAGKHYQVTAEQREEVANLWWYAPMRELGIPFTVFDNTPGSGESPLTPMVNQILRGTTMRYPLILGDRVVVDWATNDGRILKPGQPIDPTKIRHIAISYTRYFDFDK